MDSSLLLGFILASLALAFMPGPDNIYVLTESISRGWKQGVGITCGLISGITIHTTLVATGFSLFIFQFEWSYTIMKSIGALYLIYLACGTLKEKPIKVEPEAEAPTEPFTRLFKRGFLMNVLNPKVTLFFMVLLPQFVSHEYGDFSPMIQMLMLGGAFMITSFPVFAGVAIVSGKASYLLSSNRFWTVTKWIKFIVLIALAITLALSSQ